MRQSNEGKTLIAGWAALFLQAFYEQSTISIDHSLDAIYVDRYRRPRDHCFPVSAVNVSQQALAISQE
jgi:hypothetical protein